MGWSSNKLQVMVLFTVAFLVGLAILFLEYQGIIWHNNLFASSYPVKGLDVSHHQGEINWDKVAATKKYAFVYIKATEGHDFVDPRFEENWNEASRSGLLVGAYHFFSMRSSGTTQAAHFTSVVPVAETALPPVLDVEHDWDNEPDSVRNEIQNMANDLEEYYGKKPILYVMYSTYNKYINGHFPEYRVWIRDILFYPRLQDRGWFMWQYSNRGPVDGISTHVDKNVLRGELDGLLH